MSLNKKKKNILPFKRRFIRTHRLRYQTLLPEILSVETKVESTGILSGCSGKPEEVKKGFPNLYGRPVLHFVKNKSENIEHKPLKVAIVFSGGPAPGGHNVIVGLYDLLKSHNKNSELWGIYHSMSGLLEERYIVLTDEIIDQYRNIGGFNMILTGRKYTDPKVAYPSFLKFCKKSGLNALVVVGGDGSNTRAANMAEYILQNGEDISVIGIPKTIDGDIKNRFMETSFGFDTATKVYSQLIGNIMIDALSSEKYWHFVKVMGRSASHVALECALKTHPNMVLIGEEIEKRRQTLKGVIRDICDLIVERRKKGLNHGVLIIPEGLVEFIPEFSVLIHEVNEIVKENPNRTERWTREEMIEQLNGNSLELYSNLPKGIARELLYSKDWCGDITLSKIATDKLLKWSCKKELKKRGYDNFSCMTHFFGYEGRCGYPSNFDCDYCYALGNTAGRFIEAGVTGVMCGVNGTWKSNEEWIPFGMPFPEMFLMTDNNFQTGLNPVAKRILVDLEGAPFKTYLKYRDYWRMNDSYVAIGPIQFHGDTKDERTITLLLEHKNKKNWMDKLLDASVKHVDGLSLLIEEKKFLTFLHKHLVTYQKSQETDYILILIKSWAKNYASRNIVSLYYQLKKKGFDFPSRGEIGQIPKFPSKYQKLRDKIRKKSVQMNTQILKPTNRIIYGGSMVNTKITIPTNSFDQQLYLAQKIISANRNISQEEKNLKFLYLVKSTSTTLIEILMNWNSRKNIKNDQFANELLVKCKNYKPRVMNIVQQVVGNEKLLNFALEINDILNSTSVFFKEILKNGELSKKSRSRLNQKQSTSIHKAGNKTKKKVKMNKTKKKQTEEEEIKIFSNKGQTITKVNTNQYKIKKGNNATSVNENKNEMRIDNLLGIEFGGAQTQKINQQQSYDKGQTNSFSEEKTIDFFMGEIPLENEPNIYQTQTQSQSLKNEKDDRLINEEFAKITNRRYQKKYLFNNRQNSEIKVELQSRQQIQPKEGNDDSIDDEFEQFFSSRKIKKF
ncbi:pyrophosphate--fructose 6-phosphate 1-phosphotransferase [Anaeramoeba flamelloides]|uniref:Probable ATP-dependent 6-phosphofructokinase n=1 Tax=Anaeramoeba flamelloides TaxID=1746091 RepID=A0ABQ8X1U7_9EUKA|nr:pyrophosphate--fructose 6-phosphate 1-phosphotransferase [Anaeramoeba flamelloides]